MSAKGLEYGTTGAISVECSTARRRRRIFLRVGHATWANAAARRVAVAFVV